MESARTGTPKGEVGESVAYRPHLNQTGAKDEGISRRLDKLAPLRVKEIQVRKPQVSEIV
jgi:hypothetical protein